MIIWIQKEIYTVVELYNAVKAICPEMSTTYIKYAY